MAIATSTAIVAGVAAAAAAGGAAYSARQKRKGLQEAAKARIQGLKEGEVASLDVLEEGYEETRSILIRSTQSAYDMLMALEPEQEQIYANMYEASVSAFAQGLDLAKVDIEKYSRDSLAEIDKAEKSMGRVLDESEKKQIKARQMQLQTQKETLAPYIEAGKEGLARISSAEQDVEMSPLYQMQLKQGLSQIDRAFAKQGKLHSGAHKQAVSDFTQSLQAQEVESQYARNLAAGKTLADYGYRASSQLAEATGDVGRGTSQIYSDIGKQRTSSLEEAQRQRLQVYGTRGEASGRLNMMGGQYRAETGKELLRELGQRKYEIGKSGVAMQLSEGSTLSSLADKYYGELADVLYTTAVKKGDARATSALARRNERAAQGANIGNLISSLALSVGGGMGGAAGSSGSGASYLATNLKLLNEAQARKNEA